MFFSAKKKLETSHFDLVDGGPDVAAVRVSIL
jgi:hypothetical protein